MDIFLDLPLEITRTLVVDWLGHVDLVFLDTAYCNEERREQWEKVLRLAAHFANYDVPYSSDLFEMYQNWVFSREIPTRRLLLGENVDSELLDAYLQKLGGFIEEVTFQDLKANEEDFGLFAALVEEHCDNIVRLTCTSCLLDAGMMTMMNYKSKLLHLKVVDCNDIEPEFNDLASWEGSNHMQLSSVWLYCQYSMWFVESVLKLVDPCVLQQLSITIDDYVRHDLLVAFFPLCCNLLALGFSGSDYLDDGYFNSLIQFCPNVLHLDISWCTALTDDIADELVGGMTQLRTLNISGTKLSDVFINVLTAHFAHSLQALYASNCVEIDEGFDVLVSNAPSLHTLECSCCDIVAEEDPIIMDNLTTLILSHDYGQSIYEAFDWVVGHGERFEHLRFYLREYYSSLDFGELTEEALPRLQTLSVVFEEEAEEPDELQELRAARPDLRVYYNTNALEYDLMKLPPAVL